MSVLIHDSAQVVVDRILKLADHDSQFRAALADLLAGLTALPSEADETPVADAVPMVAPENEETGRPPATQVASSPAPAIDWTGRPKEQLQSDLTAIEARCRLKAEGARWAAGRQRCLNGGIPYSTAIEPRDKELIERAKTLGCILWMNGPSSPHPNDLALFDVLGSCFDVAGDAAALLRECASDVEDEELFKQCLDVAAEAQSALRSAVMAVEAPTDADQQSLFEWLRTTAAEEGIFVQRHLRADDPADPYISADIQHRIQVIRAACQAVIDHRVQHTRRLNRLRYHTKLICENGSNDHDWKIVAQVADEMVRDGVPPSNREIRDAMMPILDALPMGNGFPPAFVLVVREAERYRATRTSQSPDRADVEPSAHVLAVRKCLEGKTIVIIGGDLVGHRRQAIKEAFALGDLVWVESRHHQSIERFKPAIVRPDVKIVVLMVRWASHSYHELKPFCDQHGKLFVRLPGGYNPNQLASQIIAQCGYLLTQEAASIAQEGQRS
jgi:hypothetical protein